MAGSIRRIGLTGGIGSGKSAVAAAWARRGACIVDTDAISRQLTAAGGRAIDALREAFGASVIDTSGALDRARMRQLAFAEPATRRRLELILHPLIGDETRRRSAEAGDAVVVFDVPLLVESGRWRSQVERVLVVDCSVATQVERVMRRSGWEREIVERVIAQQATRGARREVADAVICNDGIDMQALDHEAGALWHCWCG